MDLREALESLDVQVLGPVATLEAGLGLLRCHDDLAGAILDVTLQEALVSPLAEALRQREVPFVFFTGYEVSAIVPAFRDVVRCEKPSRAGQVALTLQAQITNLRQASLAP
jgi:hypothetical protein